MPDGMTQLIGKNLYGYDAYDRQATVPNIEVYRKIFAGTVISGVHVFSGSQLHSKWW